MSNMKLVWSVLLCLIFQRMHAALAALQVTKHPNNATVYAGQNHTLDCMFSAVVGKCFWESNKIVSDIADRYQYLSSNGSNTTDCSLQIRNFKNEFDMGPWRCKANDHSDANHTKFSDEAFLFNITTILPNRTAILLNDISVTELWVPKDGSQNGSLSCVAQNATPAASLYWNITTGPTQIRLGSSLPPACSDDLCNTTLEWIGDWKQLMNATVLSCIVLQGNYSAVLNATLRFQDKPPDTASAQLGAGAIAGIVIGVILAIIVIAALVYFFVLRPRNKAKQPAPTVVDYLPKANQKFDTPSPSHSAETVRMNGDDDMKPAPQSPAKTPLLKNGTGKIELFDDGKDSDDSEEKTQLPEINNRYSQPFSYTKGRLTFRNGNDE